MKPTSPWSQHNATSLWDIWKRDTQQLSSHTPPPQPIRAAGVDALSATCAGWRKSKVELVRSGALQHTPRPRNAQRADAQTTTACGKPGSLAASRAEAAAGGARAWREALLQEGAAAGRDSRMCWTGGAHAGAAAAAAAAATPGHAQGAPDAGPSYPAPFMRRSACLSSPEIRQGRSVTNLLFSA